MLSTILELLGMLLLVLAMGWAFGPAAALFAAGVFCLVASWAMQRSSRSS